jgi:hypothetical protein
MEFLRFVPSKFQIEVATPVPKGLPEWGVKRGWANRLNGTDNVALPVTVGSGFSC